MLLTCIELPVEIPVIITQSITSFCSYIFDIFSTHSMLHSLFNSPCDFCIISQIIEITSNMILDLWHACSALSVPSAYASWVFSIPLYEYWVKMLIESITNLCVRWPVGLRTNTCLWVVFGLCQPRFTQPCGKSVKPYSAHFLLITLQMPLSWLQ